MSIEIFWIDKKGNKYTKEQVSDNHLKNIVGYLQKGGYGYGDFAKLDIVKGILNESIRRNIYSKDAAVQILNTIIEIREEMTAYKIKQTEKWFDIQFKDKVMNM